MNLARRQLTGKVSAREWHLVDRTAAASARFWRFRKQPMACPLCGDVCRCAPESRLSTSDVRSHPHIQPRLEAIRGEANEATAQPLAAQEGQSDEELSKLRRQQNCDSNTWREEIAARVHRYRSRRRWRGPRYPSPRLKFDTADPVNQPHVRATPCSGSAAMHDAHSGAAENMGSGVLSARQSPVHQRETELPEKTLPNKFRETTARIIAFPRSSPIPVPVDELAEPVLDRPRIVEAPEIAPALPALGGILLEPVQAKEIEKRPGFDVPLHSAGVEQRLLAAAADGLIVLAASIMFGYLFFRITGLKPPVPSLVTASVLALSVFWTAYEYLLLVYTGSTPGLRAAKLRLSRFDGTPPSRSLRRWRVLASMLSAISLGMGYVWCFLDEDALCWHDRITRTYLEPR